MDRRGFILASSAAFFAGCLPRAAPRRLPADDPRAFDFGDDTLVAFLADGTVWTSRARGIKPLLEVVDGAGADFARARCYDRIVGRAAAFLYVRLRVAAVLAPVMSEGAAKILARHGIAASAGLLVPEIRNRRNDGPCPMDLAVRGVGDDDVEDAVEILRHR